MIIARYKEDVPAIEELLYGSVMLRMVCPIDEDPVFYRGVSFLWKCDTCEKRFFPNSPNKVANYYRLNDEETQKRHTPSQWIAFWWNLDPELVQVRWDS